MTIKIRKATKADLPKLLEFEQGVIASERPYDKQLKDDPISYYDLEKLIESDNSEVLVAELNGHLIASGYALIRDSKPCLKSPKQTYLGFMFVEPNYRGQAVNQLIVDGLIEWSRSQNIYEIILDVYADNLAAIRAYHKAGFEKNLVQMRLNLNETK
jgi:ribosomal protein S18 acetylase RimI-like enzyme